MQGRSDRISTDLGGSKNRRIGDSMCVCVCVFMFTYLQGSQTTIPKPGQSISLMYSHSLLSQTQAGAVRPPHNAIKVTKANTKTLFMVFRRARTAYAP